MSSLSLIRASISNDMFIVDRWPELPEIVQTMLDENVKLFEVPEKLEARGMHVRFAHQCMTVRC